MIRIVNFKRFVVCNTVLLLLFFIFISAIVNNSFSHTEPKYKTIYTEEGDTLWNIANEEKENNDYYKNKDVRDIVCSIKKVNNLKVSNLDIGQKLLIPIN